MISGFRFQVSGFRQALCALPLAWLWFVLINDLRVEWTVNPQYGYGWAVPFLCAFLLWQKIQQPAVSRRLSVAGVSAGRKFQLSGFSFQVLFVLLALLYAPTRLVQEANPGWRLVSWALALEVVGLTLLFVRLALGPQRFQVSGFRFQVSAFVFPICFFLVAVPWPSHFEIPLIQGLTRADTGITTELLGWLGIPAMPHGNVIEVATGMVGIDEACSGIRSFQATLMISLFLGELYRLTVLRRTVFCLAGFALSFLFNLARMSLLVWVAARQGVAAIASWHDPAGVTILVACFFSLWGMGVWLCRRQRAEGGRRRADNGGRTTDNGGRTTDDGQRRTDDGGRTTDDGQRRADNGGRTTDDGGRTAESGYPSGKAETLPGEVERQTLHGPGKTEKLKPGNPTAISASQHFSVSAFSPNVSILAFQLSAFSIALTAWIALTELSVEAWYHFHETRVPAAVQWTVAWPAKNPTFKELPLAGATRQILRYDEGRSAAWAADGLRWQAVFLRWKPGRTAIHLAQNHTPELCMTAAGHTLKSIAPQEWLEVNGLRMPFSMNEVTDAARPFFVFYCLWDDRASAQGFATMSLTYGNRLAPVLAGLRNPGQRSLEIAVSGPDNAAAAGAALRAELDKLIISKQ